MDYNWVCLFVLWRFDVGSYTFFKPYDEGTYIKTSPDKYNELSPIRNLIPTQLLYASVRIQSFVVLTSSEKALCHWFFCLYWIMYEKKNNFEEINIEGNLPKNWGEKKSIISQI